MSNPTIVIETSKAATDALPNLARWQHFPEADLYYAEVTEQEAVAVVGALAKAGLPARAIDQTSGADLTQELTATPAQEAVQQQAVASAEQVVADKVAAATKDLPYESPEGVVVAYRPAKMEDGQIGIVRTHDGTMMRISTPPGETVTADMARQFADNLNRTVAVPREQRMGGKQQGPPPLAQAPVLKPVVEPKSLGQVVGWPTTLRVLDREVADAPAKLVAVRKDGEVRHRLECGDYEEAAKRTPSVAFAGTPSTPATFRDDQVRYGYGATYQGPMYLAHSGRGFAFVTTDPNHPQVMQGMRVVAISMPGDLIVKPAKDSPAIVVSQGQEALRLNGGSLTKTVVAVPVDSQGNPQACDLVAYRHFKSHTKQYPDGSPKVFLTSKYTIHAGPEGWQVQQYDGRKSVQEYQALQKDLRPLVIASLKAADPDAIAPKREAFDAALAERGLHIEQRPSGSLSVGKPGQDAVPLRSLLDEATYQHLQSQYPRPAVAAQQSGPAQSAGR